MLSISSQCFSMLDTVCPFPFAFYSLIVVANILLDAVFASLPVVPPSKAATHSSPAC